MSISYIATKLVVRDVEAAERFYCGLGLKVVGRNVGGEEEVRQQQSWLSESGDQSTPVLILTRFLELPTPPSPVYPGEIWLAFSVPDVEAALKTIEEAGGKTVRPGEDRPEHAVRAAVASDPEGHLIELVGPMRTG
jgi:catechol 2,3-dioxygenase-like lactoylglutathione lyase family enzyme